MKKVPKNHSSSGLSPSEQRSGSSSPAPISAAAISTQNSLQSCRASLIDTLKEAKTKGQLTSSLRPGTPEFERLEFYGDAALDYRVSMNLKQTRSWLDPHVLTSLRTACVSNATLAVVFSKLHLSEILPKDWLVVSKHGSDIVKASADVVEAILGELADRQPDLADQLITFITYIGERKWFKANPDDPNNPTPKTSPKRGGGRQPRVLGVNIHEMPKAVDEGPSIEDLPLTGDQPTAQARFTRQADSLRFAKPKVDGSHLLASPPENLVNRPQHCPAAFSCVQSQFFGSRLVRVLQPKSSSIDS